MTNGAMEVKMKRGRRKGEAFIVEIREEVNGSVVQTVSKHSSVESARTEIAERLEQNQSRRDGFEGG